MIEALSWLMRAALLAGGLVAVGHVLVLWIHRQSAPRIVPAALIFLAAFGGFALQGAALTGTLAGAVDPEMLGLLWSTPQGTALCFHVAGAAVLCIGALVGSAWTQAIGSAALLAGFLAVGHVADVAGFALSAVLALHLVLAAYWVGVLWPLYRLAGQAPAEAADLGRAFGRFAVIAVPVLLALGVVLAVVLLGRPQLLWTTTYGAILLAKILAVAAMLGLGAANKLRHVPALEARKPGAARALQKSLMFEGFAGLVIVGATAALTTLTGVP